MSKLEVEIPAISRNPATAESPADPGKPRRRTAGIPLIGFEPNAATSASNRARVDPVVRELRARGVDVAVVDADAPCIVRVTSTWDRPYRPGSHRHLVFNCSNNILNPPHRGLWKDLYFALRTRRRIIRRLRSCDFVAAGSAEQARAFSAHSSVVRIPDVATYLDQAANVMRKRAPATGPLVFGWDGQGQNFPYLETLVRSVPDFFRREDVRLHVVTDRYDAHLGRSNEEALDRLGVNATFREWRLAHQVADVGWAHVGLAPLDLACPFARSKPENKAVGYLSLGMPAVCSATPAYTDLAGRCAAVTVCDGPASWRAALEGLADARARIPELGRAGWAYVSAHYAVAPVADQWQRLLERLVTP